MSLPHFVSQVQRFPILFHIYNGHTCTHLPPYAVGLCSLRRLMRLNVGEMVGVEGGAMRIAHAARSVRAPHC